MEWLATHIEHWPITRLTPEARNARLHSEGQIAQIAASIAEFGFVTPCLIGSDGRLIAGHGRLAAAETLGLTQIPVIVLDHLSDTQRRALLLADNRLAELASWDEDVLRAQLDALQQEGFNLDLTGFDLDAVTALLDDEPEASTDAPDCLPETPADPVSNPGDLWQLGPHRLLCGDATVPGDYACLLQGETAQMVFTDPPYNVNYTNTPKDRQHDKTRAILNDNLGDRFKDFLLAALTPMLASCHGALYIAMSSSELDALQWAFLSAGGHWSTFIVWAKNTFTLGRADYQRQYEPILYGWRDGAQRHWCGDRDQGDVWHINKPQRNALHPTMKPVELVERAIRNSSRRGDPILDPFAGSGTTLIAAERTERLAFLMELNPGYVDVIVRRWEQFTGQHAERINASSPWES